MRSTITRRAVALTIVLLAACPAVAQQLRHREVRTTIGDRMPDYRTWYYLLHTDLEVPLARETALRLTRMFQEYERRASGMGRISRRLNVYLYARDADYISDTGRPNSGGLFSPSNGIFARSYLDRPHYRWETLQHECFHQYAEYVIHREMPVWLNEGLATYFGSAVWTGDGFVTHVRPSEHVEDLQERLANGQPIRFASLFAMPDEEWYATTAEDLERGRWQYTQAWSIIYFLLHAEDGRYAQGLSRHLNNVHRNRGQDVGRFNQALIELKDTWEQWWLDLDTSATMAALDPEYEAVVATLTSFLARAHLNRQAFETGEAFLDAAASHALEMPENTSYQWLPWSLLDENLSRLADLNEKARDVDEADSAVITIDTTGETPQLILTRADGATFTGSFTTRRRDVDDVDVTIVYPDNGDEDIEDEGDDEDS
ncbi:MAG: DUF1570 domain-containing protein [Planctomycetota bacterium]|jgi:hypothetical protein